MIKVFVFPSCNEPGLEIVRSLIDQPDVEGGVAEHGVLEGLEFGPELAIADREGVAKLFDGIVAQFGCRAPLLW